MSPLFPNLITPASTEFRGALKPAASAEPLAAHEFATLMQPFGPFKSGTGFALAVSGGPDSMALAWCMRAWAEGARARIFALIVDHKLRPESGTEARRTAEHLKKLGIQSEILAWEHPPLASKIHLVARKARYRLLTEACRRHDLDYLLTAHQREDQGETILMRLAKGSGIDGLCGISAKTASDGIDLLRPFLPIAKDRLIATCAAANITTVNDPSNDSDQYARGRLRRVLGLLESEGLTIERLTDLGSRASEAREALDHYTNMLLRVAGQSDDTGLVTLTLEHLRAAPKAIVARALVAIMQSIQPEDYPPENDAVIRLRNLLLAEGDMTPRTLHGCMIYKTNAQAFIVREASAISAVTHIRPGQTVTWDKRWRVTLATENNSATEPGNDNFTIRALGNPPHEILDQLAPTLRRVIPQGRIRAALPALWRGENLVFIPRFGVLEITGPASAELINSWR